MVLYDSWLELPQSLGLRLRWMAYLGLEALHDSSIELRPRWAQEGVRRVWLSEVLGLPSQRKGELVNLLCLGEPGLLESCRRGRLHHRFDSYLLPLLLLESRGQWRHVGSRVVWRFAAW